METKTEMEEWLTVRNGSPLGSGGASGNLGVLALHFLVDARPFLAEAFQQAALTEIQGHWSSPLKTLA